MTLITQLNDTLGNFPPFVEGVAPEKVKGYFGELDALKFEGAEWLFIEAGSISMVPPIVYMFVAQFDTTSPAPSCLFGGGAPSFFLTRYDEFNIGSSFTFPGDREPHVFTLIYAGDNVVRIDGEVAYVYEQEATTNRRALGTNLNSSGEPTSIGKGHVGPVLWRNDIDMPAIERMEDMLMQLAKIGPYAPGPADLIIEAMAVPPSPEREQLIRDTVDELVDAGIWDKLDCLALFAAHDEQAALVNWKDPSTPLINATMTHGTDYGFTSTDGSNIQWAMLTAGAQYTETDALLAHYTDATDLEVQYLYTGLTLDGETSLSNITWNGSTDLITYRVNRNAGIGSGPGSVTNPSGFIAAYRQGNSNYLWTPNLTHGPSAPGDSIALGNVISAGEEPNPIINIGATFKALVVGAYVDPAALNTILTNYLDGLVGTAEGFTFKAGISPTPGVGDFYGYGEDQEASMGEAITAPELLGATVYSINTGPGLQDTHLIAFNIEIPSFATLANHQLEIDGFGTFRFNDVWFALESPGFGSSGYMWLHEADFVEDQIYTTRITPAPTPEGVTIIAGDMIVGVEDRYSGWADASVWPPNGLGERVGTISSELNVIGVQYIYAFEEIEVTVSGVNIEDLEDFVLRVGPAEYRFADHSFSSISGGNAMISWAGAPLFEGGEYVVTYEREATLGATITAGSIPFEGDTLVGWADPVAWPPSGVGSIEGVISSTAQVAACYLRTNPNLVEIILMGEVLSEVGGYTLQVDNATYPVSEATFTLEQGGLTYIAWPADFPLFEGGEYVVTYEREATRGATITAELVTAGGSDYIGWGTSNVWSPNGMGSIDGDISDTYTIEGFIYYDDWGEIEIDIVSDVRDQIGGYSLYIDDQEFRVGDHEYMGMIGNFTVVSWLLANPLVGEQEYQVYFGPSS